MTRRLLAERSWLGTGASETQELEAAINKIAINSFVLLCQELRQFAHLIAA
jgi:hypothetical protein